MSTEVVLVTGAKSPTDFDPVAILALLIALAIGVYFVYFKGRPDRVEKAKEKLSKLFGKLKKGKEMAADKVEPLVAASTYWEREELISKIAARDKVIEAQKLLIAQLEKRVSAPAPKPELPVVVTPPSGFL